ncbi:MAG: helix-turn-helix transcriptional regulator [Clostridia bacterium]|nr:helix-turn-helix transcriptional regulator [Clostridia bacterium]MBQ4562253.1 helix-turn-helix transcriptional regulator [Clostridia bacterium]
MPELEALSKKILKFRHEHRESQLEFAEHCDISHYTMSSIENVADDVKVSTVQKIAAYTGMTVSELLDPE